MTHLPANDETFLDDVLRVTRWRIRLVNVGSAALILLAAAVVLLLAVVVADHVTPGGLSAGVRQ
ncbi:MAG: hypothetical protein GVY16_02355 [Planctomycetes bacterium]|nr:hypothetical protein [Planctomycetota bacterium]